MKKNNFSKSYLLLLSLCSMGLLSSLHQVSAQEVTSGDTDFLVIIPSGYELSNDHQLDKNEVLISDKADYTQKYRGEHEVSVKIQSSNNFILGSSDEEQAGKYRLIDENKKEIVADGQKISFTLSEDNTRQILNAQLTKKASDKIKASDQLLFTYKNEASITLREDHINKEIDEVYSEVELRDNIVALTNSKGEDVLSLDKAKVQITAKDKKGSDISLSDLTKVPGTYTITYSYKGMKANLTLEVGQQFVPPLVSDDESTINFMGMTWTVLRGPSVMGEGNYLVAAEEIGNSKFNNDSKFFETNDRNQDGYLRSNVKQMIDAWYEANVKDTVYEQAIQPVVLPNPTLGDMIDYGILKSNTEQGDYYSYWKSQDTRYRTKVDEKNGVKQAFSLSGADVSSGIVAQEGTKLTPEALAWRSTFKKGVWLRSPGAYGSDAAAVGPNYENVVRDYVGDTLSVVPSLVMHINDETKITLKNTNFVKGIEDNYGEADLRDNIIGLINNKGDNVLDSDRDKVQITVKDASGNNIALTDLTKAVGTYTINYSYNKKTVESTLTVKDEASITLKENSISKNIASTYGEIELRDNIVGLTNKIGEDTLATDKSKVQITAKDASGNNVTLTDLTKVVGNYNITYSYNNKTAKLALTIDDFNAKAPNLSEDGSTINFMGRSWLILRGPSDMGKGNYLIAGQEEIGKARFNNDDKYFETNDQNQEGYIRSNVKQMIDAWYKANVESTAYEKYVQPVVLPNTTLGDMIDYGILKTNTENIKDGYNNWWRSQDVKYRTKVDETIGIKQAFALSSADVSTGQRGDWLDTYTTSITPAASILGKQFDSLWLRSPGRWFGFGACLNELSTVGDAAIGHELSVIPSLIIRVESNVNITLGETKIVKNSGDNCGEIELRNNIVKLNKSGKDILTKDKSKVRITVKDVFGNNVVLSDMTKKVGTYLVTYTYEGGSASATVIVNPNPNPDPSPNPNPDPDPNPDEPQSPVVVDKTNITLAKKIIIQYVGDSNVEKELRDNIVGLTNTKGENVLRSDKSKVEITAYHNVALSNLIKNPGTYTITYSYNGKKVKAELHVRDLTRISLKKTQLDVPGDEAYDIQSVIRNNIATLTDTSGRDVLTTDKENVKITFKNKQGKILSWSDIVHAKVPYSDYTVVYSYGSASVTANLHVVIL